MKLFVFPLIQKFLAAENSQHYALLMCRTLNFLDETRAFIFDIESIFDQQPDHILIKTLFSIKLIELFFRVLKNLIFQSFLIFCVFKQKLEAFNVDTFTLNNSAERIFEISHD